MKTPKFMMVRWFDSTYYDGQTAPEEAAEMELLTMETVGHLIAERDDCVILGMEQNSQGNYRHVTMIPNVNIVKRVRLK